MNNIRIFILFLGLSISQIGFSQNIELAFCLDLSGSTNGVMDRFRTDFWDIINNIGSYTPTPNLKVGIVGFGSPAFGKKHSYIRKISDFSENIDEVAHKLYKLNRITSTGNTYVDRSLAYSLKKLSWSNNANTKKLLFLIGNGPAESMMFKNEWFLKQMQQKGVTVVAIYLSKDGNLKGFLDWQFFSNDLGINCKRIDLDIVDDINLNNRLIELNRAYNETIVYYGKKGLHNYSKYLDLDSLISFTSPVAIHGRFTYKTSDFYHKNPNWDLVDLANQNQVNFNTIDRDLLPGNLDNLEIESLVERKSKERYQLVTKIKMYNMSVKYGQEPKAADDEIGFKSYIKNVCNQYLR